MAGFNPERTCLNRGPSFPFFPSRPGLGLTPRFTVGLQLFHSSCTQCTARTLHTTHIHHLPRHAMPMPMLCYAMLCSIPEAEFSAQLPDSLILLIHDYYIHNSIMSTVLYFFFMEMQVKPVSYCPCMQLCRTGRAGGCISHQRRKLPNVLIRPGIGDGRAVTVK